MGFLREGNSKYITVEAARQTAVVPLSTEPFLSEPFARSTTKSNHHVALLDSFFMVVSWVSLSSLWPETQSYNCTPASVNEFLVVFPFLKNRPLPAYDSSPAVAIIDSRECTCGKNAVTASCAINFRTIMFWILYPKSSDSSRIDSHLLLKHGPMIISGRATPPCFKAWYVIIIMLITTHSFVHFNMSLLLSPVIHLFWPVSRNSRIWLHICDSKRSAGCPPAYTSSITPQSTFCHSTSSESWYMLEHVSEQNIIIWPMTSACSLVQNSFENEAVNVSVIACRMVLPSWGRKKDLQSIINASHQSKSLDFLLWLMIVSRTEEKRLSSRSWDMLSIDVTMSKKKGRRSDILSLALSAQIWIASESMTCTRRDVQNFESRDAKLTADGRWFEALLADLEVIEFRFDLFLQGNDASFKKHFISERQIISSCCGIFDSFCEALVINWQQVIQGVS